MQRSPTSRRRDHVNRRNCSFHKFNNQRGQKL
jgi:hypothetical protein